MRLIDTHCHIDLYDDPVQVVDEAMMAGITVVAVTNAPFVFDACRKLTSRAPSVHVAVGLHPELVEEYGHQVDDLVVRIRTARFVGEVGIDYRVTRPETHGRQRDIFQQVVRACAGHPSTVMTVHSRGAEADVVRILEDRGDSTAILHWYSGAIKYMQHAQENGCYFSVNPAMLVSQNGRKLLARMSRERVLTETDGPYIKINGQRARPPDTAVVIRGLAEVWGTTLETAAGVVADNWARVLGSTS